ncbi:MAG: prolipoprotein diacylglyceryl transferase [Desulfobacteraceae bacterium]|nr:MAG: prolipoprotein diacylglyceryl transferase [Desulfobacteraceae bacterium]
MNFYNHNIDPVIFRVWLLEFRWYGLMYGIGFLCSYLLIARQLKKLNLPTTLLSDLYFYLILGLIVGARLGYVFIYNFSDYLHDPLEIFMIHHGGLSFHGGLVGTVAAAFYFVKSKKQDFRFWSDLLVPTAPIGIALVRVGNFINGELYGRTAQVPWAVIFPGEKEPRHPSQLYEALGEGLFLFLFLWFIKGRIKTKGGLLPIFLMAYGTIRFGLEFFREPDLQLGYFFSWVTMGQILCTIMILAGLGLFWCLKSKGPRGHGIKGSRV